MIKHPVTGELWGTDEEIAEALGAHIRPDTIRTWWRRGRIPSVHMPGPGRGVRVYLLTAAEEEEARTRDIGRKRATIALTVSAQ